MNKRGTEDISEKMCEIQKCGIIFFCLHISNINNTGPNIILFGRKYGKSNDISELNLCLENQFNVHIAWAYKMPSRRRAAEMLVTVTQLKR